MSMYVAFVLVVLAVVLVSVILFVRDATCTQCGHRETAMRKDIAPDTGAVRYIYTCKHCQNAWTRPDGWRWLLRARKFL